MKPRWIICEDGTEYFERFSRFLDGQFEFTEATSAGALLEAIAGSDPGAPVAGVILDLDFRRTDPAALIDEQGSVAPVGGRDEATRRRLAETQGILILRLLRARGIGTPVLLFADLDDPERARFLEASYAPLGIVTSHEGLVQTVERMNAVAVPVSRSP